ncbi:GH36-type glycosyl hydrolase domain-containing protein [Roseburia inulinivorans]|jgi:N,N'-diacetylchitobiose phosphorylase|uniref:N,N'-diacetylchitobiose phosphorylase n=1 Tax=Roseburia inulinivorans TaxID=360807 RepID=A0A412BHH6_9FIRM|nr:amylo-alpha-1,6-glucosidase [Roseburia inulinivorans]RGQ54004.1 N,N'-diacetylchitobiose phosphorylase [Roseburia inulinivorans]
MRYGHFDNEHREYVIEKVDLPTSWTNYLGVENLAVVVNHTAGGYSFYKSPEYHRITRFHGNSIPMDRPGYYVYIRDNEKKEDGTNDYFSISWQPVAKDLDKAKYQCRHGMSYTAYECEYDHIKASQTLFVPIGDDVVLWDVRVKNDGEKVRDLSLFSYLEFSFHSINIDNQNFQMSLYCAGSSYKDGIIEEDLFYEPDGYQYFTANFEPDGFDCMRDKFLGMYHTEDNPVAVINGKCSGSFEKGGNHCGSLQKNIVLQPGEEKRFIFMLGEGNREAGKVMREKYSNFENVDRAFAELHNYWERKCSKLQIETPNEGMNTLINTWTLYQSEINVMFSRFASFIEVGGRTGLGYRDTAQDAMTIPHSNPEKCRQRIEELLNGLVSKGYGLHLFDPAWFEKKEETSEDEFKSPTVIPTSEKDRIHGPEDACSDDALWLIASIVEYIKETGNVSFADKIVPYADEGEDRVYDHMKAILNFSEEQVGADGICKGLRADWNDCLNLGGGESAMVSFLHYWALQNFIELAEYLNRTEDAEHYKKVAEKVKAACDRELWDKEWYIRGITKKGKKIGTMEDEEGKVHLESNAWAVLSGAADHDKAVKAMDAVDKYLYTPYGILLNTPAYTKPDTSIGFITKVYPGLKENSAIFSHPNPWAWAAECKLGRGDMAMKYYNALCPYWQNDMIEIRESEPYSYCQFVVGKDHTAFGRARHPFMTGSGGWAYFSATQYMLGIRPDFDTLEIDPCIPADWKEFKAIRNWRGAVYHILVKNEAGVMKGVKEIYVDHKKVDKIPAEKAGTEHFIEIIMG